MGLSLSSAPSVEPVTLDEARAHLRYEEDDENSVIESQLRAAREYCERLTGRQFITATWVLKLDVFPSRTQINDWYYPGGGFIRLPRPPLQSVSSITYIDTAGDTQTLSSDNYDVDTYDEYARLSPAYNESWPSTREDINAVTITYVAGYGDERQDVPAALRQAILLLAGHWFENREAVLVGVSGQAAPKAVEDLLWMYRVIDVG